MPRSKLIKKEEPDRLAMNIKHHMDRLGLNKPDVAVIVGCSLATLYKLLESPEKFTRKSVFRLAKGFGITPIELEYAEMQLSEESLLNSGRRKKS